MSDATLWWILVAVAIATEMITGTFYLLMLSLGLGAGAVAAHLGLSMTGQLVCAALVGGGAVVVLQRLRPRPPHSLPHQANADVNMDIGQTVQVSHWQADHTAQVSYRGAMWRVEWLSDNSSTTPSPGLHRIQEVVGNRLRVVAAHATGPGPALS